VSSSASARPWAQHKAHAAEKLATCPSTASHLALLSLPAGPPASEAHWVGQGGGAPAPEQARRFAAAMASQPGGSDAVQLRTEVLSFRMVELQQVAERLGLKKTGKHLPARELSPTGIGCAACRRQGQRNVPLPPHRRSSVSPSLPLHRPQERAAGAHPGLFW
jgi:hypothetical protein